MISAKELNEHGYTTTPEIDANLSVLLERLNKVRVAWGNPMTVTSGLRSESQQEALIKSGASNAHKSKHLIGAAADIADEDGFKDWVKASMSLMEEIGFWFEDFDHTPGWVHFQILPPASGSRVFIP